MALRIKNWEEFQHYKGRTPPWIKLYRKLLDDPQWFALSGDASKMLANCWLLASELDGELPDIATIAFRLRMPENRAKELISQLSHWLEADASTMLADRKQDACPETETDTEIDTEIDTETEKKARADAPEPDFDFADGPSQSAEDRYWELVGELEKRGVARSMCGRLLKSYRDFEASRRCLEAAFKAKDPARYIGKAISNMREEAKHEPTGDPERIPKDWPEPVKEIVRLGGHVSWLRENRWRHGSSIIDGRGNVVGM